MTHLDLDQVRDLARRALRGCGASAAQAEPVADSIHDAEAEGLRNHGLAYLPVYCRHLLVGKVDGRAQPEWTRTAEAAMVVDAAHGFAHPAFLAGLDEFDAMVHGMGTGAMAITRSYSAGMLDWFLSHLARRRLVALGCSNAGPLMPAWGGARAVFGTNPMGFAVPRAGGRDPIVFDMAVSTVARAHVMDRARRGETLPEGWALDAEGRPTTDPAAALTGMVAPLGGAKGSGLALMVELLAAGLTGSNYSYQASGLLDDEGGPPGVGQLFVAFAPDRFGTEGFLAGVEALAAVLTAEPGVQLPGDRRAAHRTLAALDGVEVPEDLLAELEGFAPSGQ